MTETKIEFDPQTTIIIQEMKERTAIEEFGIPPEDVSRWSKDGQVPVITRPGLDPWDPEVGLPPEELRGPWLEGTKKEFRDEAGKHYLTRKE